MLYWHNEHSKGEPTMIRMTRACCLATLLPVLFLVGCAAPAGLEQATTGFADAATKNEKALKELDTAAAARFTRIRRDEAIARLMDSKRALVRGQTGADCTFAGNECRLRLKTSAGDDDKGAPLSYTTVIPNQIVIAHKITEYAASVRQIATLDETDKIRGAANSALGSACGLAGALAAFNPAGAGATPACNAFSAPIVSLVTFLYGEYQTHVKLSALRQATRAMQPVLERVPAVLRKSAELSADGLVTRMMVDYNDAKTRWDRNRSDQNLTGLLTAADRLDGALRTREAARTGKFVFDDFVAAHRALTDALNNQGGDFSSVLGRISQLVDKAKQLADIAEKFSAAAKAARAGAG